MYQVWLKSHDIYSSYRLKTKIWVCLRADKSVKIWQNLPISNPKLDLHNINAHIKFGENPLKFTQVVIRKWKLGVSQADNSIKLWWNLPTSNPKPDLHNINAHNKFGENPLMFSQVIIRKRSTRGWTYRHIDVQCETISATIMWQV